MRVYIVIVGVFTIGSVECVAFLLQMLLLLTHLIIVTGPNVVHVSSWSWAHSRMIVQWNIVNHLSFLLDHMILLCHMLLSNHLRLHPLNVAHLSIINRIELLVDKTNALEPSDVCILITVIISVWPRVWCYTNTIFPVWKVLVRVFLLLLHHLWSIKIMKVLNWALIW